MGTRTAVRAAASTLGPFYIRLSRPPTPVVHEPGYPFRLGQAEVMREGSDVAIVACGIMVAQALEAAESLAAEGIGARVINLATLAPVDEESLVKAAKETFYKEIAEAGRNLVSVRLQPSGTAATVTVRDGMTLITDCPFAETKEQLGGFSLIEAANLDEAVGVVFSTIEVRPVTDVDLGRSFCLRRKTRSRGRSHVF